MGDRDQVLETKSGDRDNAKPQRLRRRDIETVEKSFETQVSEALVVRDRALVHHLIRETSHVAELKAVATNSTMMGELMNALEGIALHECLDRLYEHVTNVDVLIKCIERRFEIDMSPDSFRAQFLVNRLKDEGSTWGDAEKWGRRGAWRVYALLLRLPPAHVQELKVLIAMGKHSVTKNGPEPNAKGGVLGKDGLIGIEYNEEQSNAHTGKAYADPNDVRYDLNLFDTTVAHEIAHVVDVSKTPRYSADPEFRDIAKWKDRGLANEPSELRKAIEECAYVPYPSSVTDDELPIAHKGAELMIEKTVTEPEKIEGEIVRAYGALGKDTNGQAGKYRSSVDLAENLKENSTVYKHIPRSWADARPWEAGKRTDMKTQIHQGYDKAAWYSFSNAAYDHKISRYQFREPGEDFAERYAAFHVSEPKGKGLEQKFIDWFKANDLHEDPLKGEGEK
ncbi:MAG: hypothetical protein FWC40_06295 [Proteobacteria bacterium]|nr:hypothetical protein [Pseudomonadota bacterium]